MVVDGDTVVWQGRMNAYNHAPEIRKFWVAPKTGWVPFNVWFWSNEPRTGPQNCEWGSQYNLAGFALEGEELANPGLRHYSYNSYTNIWKRFVDPGNGTFLRTATTNRFMTSTSTDGRTWNLTFAGVPHAAQLVAFTGALDGVHDPDAWGSGSESSVLVQVPAGDSSTQVTVAPAAGATALRFRLSHADETAPDGMEVFEEWTEAFPLTDAPVVRVDAVRPGFTNAVVSGELAALGRDGSSATVTVRIERAVDPSWFRTVTLPPFSAVGTFEVAVEGLETNVAYRAIAVAVATDSSSSGAVAFRTSRPTAAHASAAVVSSKFFEADLAAVVSDWGAGATWADAWVDVSPNDSFAAGETRTVFLGRLSGHLPATHVGTVEDIAPDTDYRARVRLRNSWGLESESSSVALRTSDVPLVFPDPETTAANGRVSVSLAPSYVATGTVYAVALDADGPGFSGRWETWEDQTGYGPFEWGHATVSGARVTFTFTISWTNGNLGSGVTPIVVTADTMWTAAADHAMTLAELDALTVRPGIANLYLRPGETVELIPSAPDVTFAWHTNAVFSLSTNGILTALEPGATLVYEQDATGKTNNVLGAVIVLPAEDPTGGIYLHRTFEDFDWDDSDEWEAIAPGPQGYPDAPGAIAYIVSPADLCINSSGVIGKDEHPKKARISKKTTIGYLAVGQLGWIHHNLNDKSTSPWVFSDETGNGEECLNFKTEDGSASWIRPLGHSYVTSRVLFQVPVSMENDLDIDEQNRNQDTTGWKNSRSRGLWFERPVDVGTNLFRTVRTHSYPYNFVSGHGSGVQHTGWITFRHDVLGSGTIRLEAATHVGLQGSSDHHTASFSGTWDVANGDLDPRINARYGGASLNLWGLGIGNAEKLIVRGSWHRAEKTWPRGAVVRTGFYTYDGNNYNGTDASAWTNDWQTALPGKVALDGGDLQFYPQGKMNTAAKNAASSSGGIRRNLFKIEELSVSAGPMGRIDSKNRTNSTEYPHVRTEISNLVLEAGAVVSFDLDGNQSSVSNEFFIVNEPDGWIAKGEVKRQFLPYLFVNNQIEGQEQKATIEAMSVTTTDNTKLAFRDTETGRVSLTNSVDTGNGYRRWTADEELAGGTSYYSMQLASGVTNSFAPGATVRNLAGYVDMRKGAALGRPGEDAGATLDFGDQPARIFNGNWGEVGTIGCRLAGSAGLVTGGNGTIALAASAEGVAGGVRVAGGTLALGVPGTGGTNFVGRVAGDVRVEAGSRLVVRDKASFAPGVRLFLNDRDWIPSYAHVRLESNASAAKLFVCGEAMPNGYYGSSEAALVHSDINVDDVHFEGPGVLWAGVRPTMMIFR